MSNAIFRTDVLADVNNESRHKSAECSHGQRFCSSDQEAGIVDAATKAPSLAVNPMKLNIGMKMYKKTSLDLNLQPMNLE